MKSFNVSEIEELSPSAEQEDPKNLIHLKRFFAIYMSKFIASAHLPKAVLLETEKDRELQRLSKDQKGHLFSCRKCFSTFFSSELNLDVSESLTSEDQRNSLMERLLQNEEEHITPLEAQVEEKVFMTSIDGVRCVAETSTLTGAEIMDLAGIPREIGLVMVLEDGTQVQVKEEEVVELRQGRKFKRAPRFMRG